ncbi:hypothetical protein IQ268_12250 [Oculatella sp. LEGE 06141]|uniref:hypothetical protein n=1 Tax=Oculatella sp. LEGE 06141 TaxID=1828648 RepID=UPI0018809D81|nr:hypothetical protein [Oculatella sp. LEGE 06141]MBE9179333.1 hypothetical protein [Oculatella sp. LEGE 06141]
MTSFISSRDNDASNTIRGYVYQVDLTILRWLNLQTDERLELECGEDIDFISRCLPTGDEQRLLEQVKNYTSSISLWSSVSAIANFVEHRQSNSCGNLRFLFTTTASVKIERPSPPILKRQKGINIWEKIRLGNLEVISQEDALIGIRNILSRDTKPKKLADTTWLIFRDFVQNSSDADLLSLIHAFEWSTKAIPAEILTERIPALLIERCHATDQNHSKELYQRLFLYAFKRLSQSGLKQLTLPELTEQLQQPTLSDSDHELLSRVVSRLCSLEERVSFVETRVYSLEENLQRFPNEIATQVNAQIQRQLRDQGIDISIDHTTLPDLGIPLAVEQLSNRSESVISLISAFNRHTWIAIDGISGSGKTQLAILVVQTIGKCSAWIRLRDLSPEQASQRLDVAFRAIKPSLKQNNSRFDWYCSLCNSLENNAILVLDDLPELSGNDELSECLVQLSRACKKYGIRLFSTSPYLLPFGLRERLNEQILYATSTPPFSDSEAGGVLQAYGASISVINAYSKFINNVAQKHPQIIAAIARYLQQHDWQVTESLEDKLLRGEYHTTLIPQTIKRILDSTEDEDSRELLYRLCLPIGNFSALEVQTVASITPPLARPREHLQNLIGLWVQHDINERFLVSPLVKPLGERSLLLATKKSCHQALGDLIISKRRLTPSDTLRVILHFLGAEVFNKAGLILVSALQKLSSIDQLADEGFLLSLWSSSSLPEQMDLGTCILIRGFQIATRYKYGKPIGYLVEELDTLVEQAGEDNALEILGAVMATNLVFSKDNPQKANHYLRTALHFLPHAYIPNSSRLAFPDSSFLGFTIWTNSRSITNAEQLQDWVATVECLTFEQRDFAFSHEVAELGCLLVSETVWKHEAEKLEDEQNWSNILQIYQDLTGRIRQLELELLWACFVLAQIIIVGEFCHNLRESVQLAQQALNQVSDDPRVNFLLTQRIGQQYLNLNHNNEALTWLSRALGAETNAYPYARMKSLLNMSHVVGREDTQLAVQFAQQASDLARNTKSIDEIERVQALCELSIAKWLATNIFDAFETWVEAGEQLLSCRSDSDFWKEMFLRYGHVSGYFTMLAHTGSPPSVGLQSGERYAAPQRGMFLIRNSALLEYYRRDRECAVLSQLSTFAAAVGNDEQAVTWALRGIDDAREFNQFGIVSVLSLETIPHLVLNGYYAETFDIAIEAGAFFTASIQLIQTGLAPNGFEIFNLNPEEILGSRSSSSWGKADEYAALTGCIPTVFHICTLALQDAELAEQKAVEVTAICRQISETVTDRQLWLTAAVLIEQAYSHASSHDGVMNYSKSLDSNAAVLKTIGYLIATLQKDTPVQRAIRVHFAIAPFVYSQPAPMTPAYRRVILPFFVNYWRTQFERSPLLFGSHQMISQVFTQLDSIPESKLLQFLLVAVSRSLEIPIAPDSAQWVIESAPELTQILVGL